ncbi:hypothetical protein LINPERPRIM_LOCUS18924, partial [Linum perenne]
MGFYPTYKGGPKAVITSDATPQTVYALHQYGMIDTIYTRKMTIFDEFPIKFKITVKRYFDTFAKGREIYLKYTASYPIFNQEEVTIQSKALIKMGISNGVYPTRDDLMTTPIPETYQTKSLFAVSQAIFYLKP